MTHTRGPWTATDHGDRRHREFAIMSETGNAHDGGRGKIASVFAGYGHHFTFEQAEGNARLIAASPNLLEYAIAQEKRDAGLSPPWNIDDSGHRCAWCADCIDRLSSMRRAAISKATA